MGCLFSKVAIKPFDPYTFTIKQCSLQEPMAVGIYCGDSKVSNLEHFLHVFIVEMDGLLANAISFDGVHFQIILHSFVCDAPARALLKNIKGHSGQGRIQDSSQRGSSCLPFPVPLFPLPVIFDRFKSEKLQVYNLMFDL